jgi:molybdopterin converting factor small subunit
MPRVFIAPHLRHHVDFPTQQVAGRTVAEALQAAFVIAPRLRGYVLDDQGRLRQHVFIFVQGRRVRDRDTLADPVDDDDELHVFQALTGG